MSDDRNGKELPEPSYDEVANEGSGSISLGPGTIDPRDYQPRGWNSESEIYIAVLVNECAPESGEGEPFYEEAFVLLTADSEQEAREKATEYGKQQQSSYEDENHQLVRWKLKHVVDVHPVEDATFDDGTELFSRFFRDYSSYHAFEPRLGGEEP